MNKIKSSLLRSCLIAVVLSGCSLNSDNQLAQFIQQQKLDLINELLNDIKHIGTTDEIRAKFKQNYEIKLEVLISMINTSSSKNDAEKQKVKQNLANIVKKEVEKQPENEKRFIEDINKKYF